MEGIMILVNLFNLDAPVDRYDNICKNSAIEKNGYINLKKLTEENKNEDTTKIKKLTHELENVKAKYSSVKEDFELMVLNNNELKLAINKLLEKNTIVDCEGFEKTQKELREENRKLIERIDNLELTVKKISEELQNKEKEIQENKPEEKIVIQEKIVYVEKEKIVEREIEKLSNIVLEKINVWNLYIAGN